MKKRKRKKIEVYCAYEEMNKFQRWCVHNGFYNFYRVKNGICEYLINNKRENKIIQKILKRERNERT